MKTVNNGQRITDRTGRKIAIVIWHTIAAIGFIGVGMILSLTFFFTEDEFWSNVARFWR